MFVCAEPLTTVQLIQRTLQGVTQDSCLHYRVKGLCYWLVCDTVHCHVKTTLKVSHYLPDAVVSVYRNKNSNPWVFAKTVVDQLSYQLGLNRIACCDGK